LNSLIINSNQIKSRRYNLVIDGKIVEEMLTAREANLYRDEYRAEGFAVDKVEVFSVTKGIEIVGENAVVNRDEVATRAIGTPEATPNKINYDRSRQRAKNNGANKKRHTDGIRYTSYGRDKNSTLHAEYLANLRKNGFRVHNLLTDEVWIGLQKEIVPRIVNYVKFGGKVDDLNIKFLGAE